MAKTGSKLSSTDQRRRWLATQDYESQTYRDLAAQVAEEFGTVQPSPASIGRDVKWLREKAVEIRRDPELQRLLLPENFPELRARFFESQEGEYLTPEHQHAWYHCLYALVFKSDLPEWVIEYMELPADINTKITGKEALLTMIVLAPPRHGKSDLILHGIVVILIIDPNKRIIYCSGIKTTSQDNMGMVMEEFEYNEDLIASYGPFRDDNRMWSQQKGFQLAKRTIPQKTSSFYPIGKGSNVLSKDADLIIVDDPQDLDDAESESTTARDYKWFRSNLLTRRESHTPVFAVGSFQPSETGDMWTNVIENISDYDGVENVEIYVSTFRAHYVERCDARLDPDHVRCVLWHDKCPYWFLEAQRVSLGDLMFEVCYNQDMRKGRTTYFDPEIVRGDYSEPEKPKNDPGGHVPVLPDYSGGILDRSRSARQVPAYHCSPNHPLLVTLGVDPAASTRKGASFTAIVALAACRHCGRRFLVDYEQVRQSPERHPSLILSFVDAFHPSRVRIENNAYQKALARDPRLTEQQSKMGFTIDEWRTDERKNDPAMGIPTLAHMVNEGRLSVPYQYPEDVVWAEDFLKALILWPKKPNDVPMALWLAELSMRELLYELEFLGPITLPGYDDMAQHLKDQVYSVDMGSFGDRPSRHDVW